MSSQLQQWLKLDELTPLTLLLLRRSTWLEHFGHHQGGFVDHLSTAELRRLYLERAPLRRRWRRVSTLLGARGVAQLQSLDYSWLAQDPKPVPEDWLAQENSLLEGWLYERERWLLHRPYRGQEYLRCCPKRDGRDYYLPPPRPRVLVHWLPSGGYHFQQLHLDWKEDAPPPWSHLVEPFQSYVQFLLLKGWSLRKEVLGFICRQDLHQWSQTGPSFGPNFPGKN